MNYEVFLCNSNGVVGHVTHHGELDDEFLCTLTGLTNSMSHHIVIYRWLGPQGGVGDIYVGREGLVVLAQEIEEEKKIEKEPTFSIKVEIPEGYPLEQVTCKITGVVPEVISKSMGKPDFPISVTGDTANIFYGFWGHLENGGCYFKVLRRDVPSYIGKFEEWVKEVNEWIVKQEIMPAETAVIS
jgi:hypothetical protein